MSYDRETYMPRQEADHDLLRMRDPRYSLRARNIYPLRIERTSGGPLPDGHVVLPSQPRRVRPLNDIERAAAPHGGGDAVDGYRPAWPRGLWMAGALLLPFVVVALVRAGWL